MDESGDLGFNLQNRKTSQWFIVTFLFSRNKRQLDKSVSKVFASFTKTEVKNHHGMLHSYKELPTTRTRLLRSLNDQDISILNIRLNKNRVFTRLQDEKHVLYNYVVNILLDRMITRKMVLDGENVEFIASRRETNRFLNDNFREYLSQQSYNKLDLQILIKTPSEEKGLQAVDFLAWSFFRKYEHGDDFYVEIVKNKVIDDGTLFG